MYSFLSSGTLIGGGRCFGGFSVDSCSSKEFPLLLDSDQRLFLREQKEFFEREIEEYEQEDSSGVCKDTFLQLKTFSCHGFDDVDCCSRRRCCSWLAQLAYLFLK